MSPLPPCGRISLAAMTTTSRRVADAGVVRGARGPTDEPMRRLPRLKSETHFDDSDFESQPWRQSVEPESNAYPEQAHHVALAFK